MVIINYRFDSVGKRIRRSRIFQFQKEIWHKENIQDLRETTRIYFHISRETTGRVDVATLSNFGKRVKIMRRQKKREGIGSEMECQTLSSWTPGENAQYFSSSPNCATKLDVFQFSNSFPPCNYRLSEKCPAQ